MSLEEDKKESSMSLTRELCVYAVVIPIGGATVGGGSMWLLSSCLSPASAMGFKEFLSLYISLTLLFMLLATVWVLVRWVGHLLGAALDFLANWLQPSEEPPERPQKPRPRKYHKKRYRPGVDYPEYSYGDSSPESSTTEHSEAQFLLDPKTGKLYRVEEVTPEQASGLVKYQPSPEDIEVKPQTKELPPARNRPRAPWA